MSEDDKKEVNPSDLNPARSAAEKTSLSEIKVETLVGQKRSRIHISPIILNICSLRVQN